jgi:hypothetical protein
VATGEKVAVAEMQLLGRGLGVSTEFLSGHSWKQGRSMPVLPTLFLLLSSLPTAWLCMVLIYKGLIKAEEF